MELPIRKSIRFKNYNYGAVGYYFITICVKNRVNALGKVVGCDVLIAPIYVELSEYGHVVDKHINKINLVCGEFSVDKYVIMPNHIHMIIVKKGESSAIQDSGAMRTSRPTSSSIPSLIRSFKTMITKEIGISLWQASYHDHIIRNENDYRRIWQYIDQNPAKWADDCYYVQ